MCYFASSLSISSSCRFSQSISTPSLPGAHISFISTPFLTGLAVKSIRPCAGLMEREGKGGGGEVGVEKERLLSLLLSPDSPYAPLQCSHRHWMGGFDIYNEFSMDWLCANVPSTNGKLSQHVGYNISQLLSEKCVACDVLTAGDAVWRVLYTWSVYAFVFKYKGADVTKSFHTLCHCIIFPKME